MTNIGIIGTDNSHALAFSKLMNIPDRNTGKFMFPDMRVKCIFGLNKEENAKVASEGCVEIIVNDPAEMLGQVGAVMVVFRHGGLHTFYALPFIEAGVPTWVDKPFTIINEDARLLIDTAAKNGCLLTGGSTCKYARDLTSIKNTVDNGTRIGKLKTAAINFPATLENEYGGIYFYGAHLAEMTLMAFGYDPLSVVATTTNGLVTAIVKYDAYQVTMNFIPDSHEYYALLYGEKATMLREIDITGSYVEGLREFDGMLRTKELPLPLEDLYAPVALLNATVESYTYGREVYLRR